jgi:hypothetical protein
MYKYISFKPIDPIITEANTRLQWEYNLNVNIPCSTGYLSIEGNVLHERLKKTLKTLVPKWDSIRSNFMVATMSLVASDNKTTKVFTQPISVSFESNICSECFTDSAIFDVDPNTVERHIHQRLKVANDFMGIGLPSSYFPYEMDEFIWRSYHSEQALIEYLWKQESLNSLMNGFDMLGLRHYKHIDGIVLDLHSKYYVCEFCEVSLFGMQSKNDKKGWLNLFKKKLSYGGYQFNTDGLLMVTRVSADRAFPRQPMKDIRQTQAPLDIRDIEANRIILAKDLNQISCDRRPVIDGCTVFRSGSVYSPEATSPVKSNPSKKPRLEL